VSATNGSASLTFSGLFNPEEPDWLLQAIASAATMIAPTTKDFFGNLFLNLEQSPDCQPVKDDIRTGNHHQS
jgi:hypothetical protein